LTSRANASARQLFGEFIASTFEFSERHFLFQLLPSGGCSHRLTHEAIQGRLALVLEVENIPVTGTLLSKHLLMARSQSRSSIGNGSLWC
jgi:hypothetical protein